MAKEIEPYAIDKVGASSLTADQKNELTTQPQALGTIVGDINTEDIVIPRLNIVQSVGQLAELFNAGSVVLNKEVELPTPLELTILLARKQYVENLDFDSDERPMVFNTLEEVKAAGGTIEWEENVKPSFAQILHVHVLFKAPAGLDYALPLEYGGCAYGMAQWTLRGVAYSRAGKNIITAAKLSLRDGLLNGKWELSTKREKFGKNSVFVPVLRNAGRNTPEFVQYVRSLA